MARKPKPTGKSPRESKDSRTGARDFAAQRDKNKRRNARTEAGNSSAASNYALSQASASVLNDLAWYTRYPDQAVTAASVPFPYRPGMNVPLTRAANSANHTILFGVPGIAVLDWAPSIGQSALPTDPASTLANQLYGRIRSVYSGRLSADAPDLVMYLLALDSVFSFIGYAKRVYKLLTAYTSSNFLMPDRVLGMLGFTDEGIVGLKAERTLLLQQINQLIYMASKLHCPAVFDYFNRHYWMNEYAYLDAPSLNAQLYLFNQTHFYKFTLLPTPQEVDAGGLTLVKFDTSTVTKASDFFNFGRQLIDAVSTESNYDISGYFQRAMGDVPIFSVPLLDGTEQFDAVYAPEVLSQIENSHAIYLEDPDGYDIQFDSSSANISQDPLTNSVLSSPKTRVIEAADTTQPWYVHIEWPDSKLSLRQDVPTYADVLIASRLIATLDTKTVLTGSAYKIMCGTEVPIKWRVYDPMNSGDYNITQYFDTGSSNANVGLTPEMLRAITLLTNSDWSPFMTGFGVRDNGDVVTYGYVIGDVHNCTPITKDVLENMHRVCTFSELNAFPR